jgi:hypothetical protein
MKRRDFLRALVAMPVVAVAAPLLPAPPRAVNGELVELCPIKFYDEKLLAKALPEQMYLNWKIPAKGGTYIEWRRFSRIEPWTQT